MKTTNDIITTLREWDKFEGECCVPVPVPPQQYRYIVVTAYKAGIMTWGEAFTRLYNSGWRGRLANPSVTT